MRYNFFPSIISAVLILITVFWANSTGEKEPWSGWAGGMAGSFVGVFAAIALTNWQTELNSKDRLKQEELLEREKLRAELAERAILIDQTAHRLYWSMEYNYRIELYKSLYENNFPYQEMSNLRDEYQKRLRDFESSIDATRIIRAKKNLVKFYPEKQFLDWLLSEVFYSYSEWGYTFAKNTEVYFSIIKTDIYLIGTSQGLEIIKKYERDFEGSLSHTLSQLDESIELSLNSKPELDILDRVKSLLEAKF